MRTLDHEVVAKDRDGRHGRDRQVDLALRLAGRAQSLERCPLERIHDTGIVYGKDSRDLLLPFHLAIESDASQHAVAAAEIDRLRRLAHAEFKGLRFRREGVDLHDLAGRADPQDAEPVLVEAVEIAARTGLDPGRCIPLHGVVDEKLAAGGEVLEVCVVEVDRVVEMRVGAGDHPLSVGRGVGHRIDRVSAELPRAVAADPQNVTAAVHQAGEIHVAVTPDGHHCGRAVELRILAGDDPLERDRLGRQGHREQCHPDQRQ